MEESTRKLPNRSQSQYEVAGITVEQARATLPDKLSKRMSDEAIVRLLELLARIADIS